MCLFLVLSKTMLWERHWIKKGWSMTIYCYIIHKCVRRYIWPQINVMIKIKVNINQELFLLPQANVKNHSTFYLHKTSFGWQQILININHHKNIHYLTKLLTFLPNLLAFQLWGCVDSAVPAGRIQYFLSKRKELRYSKIC